MYAAKIICDSITEFGERLTTFEVTIPRIVLSEFNTHRWFTRSSASSRATPVAKRISMLASGMFVPEAFGKNQKGMQPGEALTGEDDARAREVWAAAAADAIRHARVLAEIGVHKQLANRLIEPFSWHTIIATATEWENWDALRCSPMAQDEIRIPAELMRDARAASTPVLLKEGSWHLPFIFPEDAELTSWNMVKVSAARCARVSYLTHDGRRDIQADLELYSRLFSSGHVAPLEHPARPMTLFERYQSRLIESTVRIERTGELHVIRTQRDGELGEHLSRTPGGWALISERETHFCGNFNGWVQHRKEIPGEAVFGSVPKLTKGVPT